MKYKKKPVVIDAIQWNGKNVDEIEAFLTDNGIIKGEYVEIATLEGIMIGSIGDYIINGVKGEFYPCKPDIFDRSYERLI